MEDAELLARLVDVLGLERDDLEHSAACEQCDLWEDSEYGRYRCPDNPAEQRERAEWRDRADERAARLARLQPHRLSEDQIAEDFMRRGGRVVKSVLADGPVLAQTIEGRTVLVLDETGALDLERTFGTIVRDA